jgi:hypothetical protein
MSSISNELVVATEYILSGTDILVKAKEDGPLGGASAGPATTPASLAPGPAHTRAAPSSLVIILFFLHGNLEGNGKVRPGRRQTIEERIVVADNGRLGELGREGGAVFL